MKKLILATVALCALGLSACSGHSDADKQQIQEAHQAAHTMLDSIPAR